MPCNAAKDPHSLGARETDLGSKWEKHFIAARNPTAKGRVVDK